MKKINLFLSLIAVVMLVGLTNCKKELENTSVTKYVGTVNASFLTQDVNISVFKHLDPFAAPVAYTRNWIMYAKNSPFYGNQPFALVKGLEFVQGSAANIWWSVDGNNPVSFAANQNVYSNLTPAEPVRLIMETKDNLGTVAYLGILDFDPTQAQFPLTVVGKRLGDVITLNTDALTKLPGANLTITAKFQLANVDVAATELGLLSPATSENSTGVTGALDFSNIIYGSLVTQMVTVPNGNGDFPLYSGIGKKVFGDIIITITEAPSPSSPDVNGSVITLIVPASSVGIAGKSTKLVLSTSKLGWYDSQTVAMSDNDISINVVDVPVIPAPVYDADGNAYTTITLGTQTWMVENLKTTKYNDGTPIPSGFSGSIGTYLWYNNDQSNKNPYGAMYNWYAVNTGKLAPVGWHVPSEAEWTTLANYVGGWYPTTTNFQKTGFTPLLAGLNYDGPNSPYLYMGSGGWWWTSSDDGGSRGWYTHFDGANNQLGTANDGKHFHFSVRCIKD
jgi:uncharacterized protein (TIGR02145 family)